jgi:hypothetical protein
MVREVDATPRCVVVVAQPAPSVPRIVSVPGA